MMNYLNKVIGGRYEINEIIGVGGMAIVYKAFDRTENRYVAVKILQEQYLEDEELRQRFKNESKAIAVMSHPNIVKVFDVNFGEDLLYIVMEHIEGINLKEYIHHKNGLDIKETLHIVMQILRALQHAHDKGIIHRDIKPQNILLLPNGTIKVTDFGIARFNRGDVKTQEDTSAIGSVHYVSPEQVRGEFTDARSDVYSMGIVLYGMLTGQVPFDAKEPNDIAVMHLQKEPIRPSVFNENTPVGLEQITMRAMQKNPKDRYQSAAEMLMDLDSFKKNPLIKFDYSYFVDKEPTKYLHVAAQPLPVSSADEMRKPEKIAKAEKTRPQKTVNVDVQAENDMKLDYYDDYEFRGRNLTVPVLSALSIILVAVVGFVMLMIFYDPLSGYFTDNEDSKLGKVFSYLSEIMGDEEMEVPNFINMTFDEVKAKYPNIKFEDPVYVLNSEFEAGRVCAQSPEASTAMTKDTVVKLTIARSATSQIAVPDVIGKNYMTAKSELSAYGFTVVLMPVFAENETIGNVIRTDPVPGTMLETLKKITVYYASSINTEVVEVPDVVGMLQSLAEEKIRAAGLVVGGISLEPSSPSLKGYVISQSPVADSEYQVAAGSAVYLVVGTGEASSSSVSFSITLPDTGEDGELYIYLNDTFYDSTTESFDGSKMALSIAGSGKDNTFEIYADEELIYSGTIDFTTDPATVNVTFRAETPSEKVLIPNVIGKTKAAAESALKSAGFTNVTFKEIDSTEAAGVVVSQNPVASSSTKYDKDTVITVYVSKGSNIDIPSEQPGEPSTQQRPPEPPATEPPTERPSTPPAFEPEEPSDGDITIF